MLRYRLWEIYLFVADIIRSLVVIKENLLNNEFTSHSEATLENDESSSPGEFHPQALTDPDVTVSRHPALIIQLPSPAMLPYPLAPPISG